jgi:hypothetical protein
MLSTAAAAPSGMDTFRWPTAGGLKSSTMGLSSGKFQSAFSSFVRSGSASGEFQSSIQI